MRVNGRERGNMKKLFVAVMMIFFTMSPFAHAEMTGKQIMEEQKIRHEIPFEYTRSVMLLVDKKGNKEKRELEDYHKKLNNSEERFLLVFLSPASIRGTALLTWDYEVGASDQWLYLPAQKRMQRIAQASKKSYFMGTDFTYEDMEPEDIDNFSYSVVGAEDVEGKTCWIIEAVPANAVKQRESGYSRRKIWVSQDSFISMKIEFFDRRDKLIKRQTGRDFVKIKGTAWRPQKTLMNNLKRKHKTLMGVQVRRIEEAVDDSVFTERYILSGKHVQ